MLVNFFIGTFIVGILFGLAITLGFFPSGQLIVGSIITWCSALFLVLTVSQK